jgi:hypothetical protein
LLGKLTPLYQKDSKGMYYHNSDSKKCWTKFQRSAYKPTDVEAGITVKTPIIPCIEGYVKAKRNI